MHQASDSARNGQHAQEQPAGAAPDGGTLDGNRQQPPVVESPPTSPHHPPVASPWWTAPAGKPVRIPDFGQVLLDKLRGLFAPEPVPVPVRVRARR